MQVNGVVGTTISAVVLCVLTLAGCATSLSTATTTVEELTGTAKGAVVMMVSFEGVPVDHCGFISVESKLAGYGGNATTRKVRSRGDPNSAFWILEPGEYDVFAVYCVDGLTMLGNAGYGQYASYAKFSVGSGEVIDAGHLIIGGVSMHRTLKVVDLPTDAVEQIKRDFPKLTSRMTKKHMVIDETKTKAQEIAWENWRANAINHSLLRYIPR